MQTKQIRIKYKPAACIPASLLLPSSPKRTKRPAASRACCSSVLIQLDDCPTKARETQFPVGLCCSCLFLLSSGASAGLQNGRWPGNLTRAKGRECGHHLPGDLCPPICEGFFSQETSYSQRRQDGESIAMEASCLGVGVGQLGM